MQFIWQHAIVWSQDRYYPLNKNSKILCLLMRRKSLTSDQLDQWKEGLDCINLIQPVAPKKKKDNDVKKSEGD